MPGLAIGVGSSVGKDSRAAAAQAAKTAKEACGKLPPAAAIVFSSYYGLDHYAMMKGLRSILGPIPLAGGTTFGEICGPKLLEGSVVVWLLASKTVSASTGLGKGMALGSFAAGAAAARLALEGLKAEPRLFIVFYETQMGDPHLGIEGAKSVLGRRFPIVGAGTGSSTIMEQNPFSKQFVDGQVLGGCFVGVLLGGDLRFECGFSHGGTPIGREFTLNMVRDNVLLELDGRPALDVFEEELGLKIGPRGMSYLDIHLGVVEPDLPGADTIRALWGADVRSRALLCGNVIQSGVRVRFTQVSVDATFKRQGEAMERARKALQGPVAGALCVDCYGRKLTLGAQGLIPRELELIHSAAGGAPLAGLYSGSEAAMLGWGQENMESRYSHQSTSFVLFGES